MFAEMRAALDSSRRLKEPLTAATAWNLATSAGASAIGYAENTLQPGYCGELLQLRAPEMQSVEDLIELGAPEMISWIQIASLPD